MSQFDGRLKGETPTLGEPPFVTRNTVQASQQAQDRAMQALGRLHDARAAYERAGAELDAASDAYAAAKRALGG